MKKTFAIILIALMAMTAVFAASNAVAPISNIGNETSKLEVSFELNPENVYFYSFGFTDSNVGGNKLNHTTNIQVPTAYTDVLALNYKNDSATANNDTSIYFYYKARTNASFNLTFTMQPLKGGKADIGWSATFTEVSSYTKAASKPEAISGPTLVKSEGSTQEGGVTQLVATVKAGDDATQDNFHWGLYQVDLLTDKIPMQDGTKTITGALTVTISA